MVRNIYISLLGYKVLEKSQNSRNLGFLILIAWFYGRIRIRTNNDGSGRLKTYGYGSTTLHETVWAILVA
jgi:hypothetical protein